MLLLVVSVTVSQLRFPKTHDLISTLGDVCALANASRLLSQETCAEAKRLQDDGVQNGRMIDSSKDPCEAV